MLAHQFQQIFGQLGVGTVKAHQCLGELGAAGYVGRRFARDDQLLVEHRPVEVAMLLTAFVLLVAEPGRFLQRQIEVNFGQQRFENLVLAAGLHPCPAIADDEAARGAGVGNDVNWIVLTLRAQILRTLKNHFRGVDLARGQGIRIDQLQADLLDIAFGGSHRRRGLVVVDRRNIFRVGFGHGHVRQRMQRKRRNDGPALDETGKLWRWFGHRHSPTGMPGMVIR